MRSLPMDFFSNSFTHLASYAQAEPGGETWQRCAPLRVDDTGFRGVLARAASVNARHPSDVGMTPHNPTSTSSLSVLKRSQGAETRAPCPVSAVSRASVWKDSLVTCATPPPAAPQSSSLLTVGGLRVSREFLRAHRLGQRE